MSRQKQRKIGSMKEEQTSIPHDFIQWLEARAKEAAEHMGDVDYMVAHLDLLRALGLVQALNGNQTILDTVKDMLKHGENAALVYLLSRKEMLPPGPYAALVALYALREYSPAEKSFPEEDLWAMYTLLSEHYEPVPYAPYTREQVTQAMHEE